MLWIGLLLSLASCKDSLDAITLGGDELPTEGITLSIQLPKFTPQEISTRAGGETTEDGLFSLKCVACLGCCSLSPVMMINESTYGSLTPEKTKKILKELREAE